MQSLVLLLRLSLSFGYSQITVNVNNIDLNSIMGNDTIETKNSYFLRLDSLNGRRGENEFLLRWNYEKNKITEEAFKKVDNTIIPVEKIVRIYNDIDLIILEFKYNWNEKLNKYQPSSTLNGSKTEFIYDDNGNNLFQYQYYWSNDKETYLPYDKEEFEYNVQGKKISRLWSTWNKELEEFDIITKREYKYDFSGNILESYYYSYASYDIKNTNDSSLRYKNKFTYSILFDEQYNEEYKWDNDLGKMHLNKKYEVRYKFTESKNFSPKNHYWSDGVLKNKIENKKDIYVPNFIRICRNDISTERITSYREYKYDNHGICILYNRFSVNKVTNIRYKSNIRARELIVDDKNKLVYYYTDSDYDLDFHKWEIDREWTEYYSKIEK